MKADLKLTLAITTYNRFDMLLQSFAEVIDDPRIDEVLIVDDCSTAAIWNKIRMLESLNPKIRTIRQGMNRGMMQNKADAISYAKNEWVALLDSDNIIKPDYLDAFYKRIQEDGGPFEHTIYCPDFAWPSFDYRKFSGRWINKGMVNPNIKDFINDDIGHMCMNTCNYILNRDAYMEIYKHSEDIKATDTIWFAYWWLKAGRVFEIVPGMSYFHRVHNGSGFLENAIYNTQKGEDIRKLIASL